MSLRIQWRYIQTMENSKQGALVSTITDKLNEYDKEFDDHLKNYNQFRRNIINKFFGSPMVVVPSLAEIKTTLDNTITKFDEITLFGRQLEAINTDITTIKNNLPRLEQIKIPHEKNINNIVYKFYLDH